MRLFDDMSRDDGSPAAYGEDSFSFLNRACGEPWTRIRRTLDEWFADFPEDGRADLRGRFRDRRPGAHWSAWWELYLHRLFTRLGYTVTLHPVIAGAPGRPDFRLSRHHDQLYVEAAVVFSDVVDESRDGTREGWIMDAIDRGSHPNFHVGIEFDCLGKKRPRDRDVYQPILQWLDTLDPDAVQADYERTDELPAKLLVIEDWQFRVSAVPVRPEARLDPSPGRLLGYGPVTAGFVNDQAQLRDTLKHKRRKYGDLDAPLVVAINCASSFMKDEDIANALYGGTAYQYVIGEAGAGKAVRVRDGVWMAHSGPRGRRLSAVLSAVQLHPETATKAVPRLWLNPWAQNIMNSDWPFTSWRCSDEGLVTSEAREVDMAALVGLPAEWPERGW